MPKETVGHAMHALHTVTRRFIDTYSHKKEHEQLTSANTWVIHFIAENRGSPVYLRDIEQHFGTTRSTASKVVDLLVRKGFVERHVGETDSRLRRLTLTPQSEALLQSIQADHEMLESVLTRGFTVNEVNTLLSYLARMQENINIAVSKRQKAEKEDHA